MFYFLQDHMYVSVHSGAADLLNLLRIIKEEQRLCVQGQREQIIAALCEDFASCVNFFPLLFQRVLHKIHFLCFCD